LQGDHFGDQVEYEVAGTPAQGLMVAVMPFSSTGPQAVPAGSFACSLDAESYVGVPLISSSGGVIGHMSVLDIEPRSEIVTRRC